MKKIFIIHKWSGTPESDWYPWLKRELEAKGYSVVVPEMPNTDHPIIEERVSFLQKIIGIPDEETYFIGHSIGCQTILRFLQTLPNTVRVGGAVFVAGWFQLENLEDDETNQIAQPWVETPIDNEKVKMICPSIKVFLSSNEPYGYVQENKNKFEQDFNADVTILENRGHFTEDDGSVSVPEVLELL